MAEDQHLFNKFDRCAIASFLHTPTTTRRHDNEGTEPFCEIGIEFYGINNPFHLSFFTNVERRIQESFRNRPPQAVHLHKITCYHDTALPYIHLRGIEVCVEESGKVSWKEWMEAFQ